MSNWHNDNTDNLCKALLSLKTEEECYNFLEDICTIKEVLDIAQRLQVAGMLKKKMSYATICKETGVSTATISRISKCCEYGNGGYKTVLERIDGNKNNTEK